MKQQTVEQIKKIIETNDTLSSSEKKELLKSLELVAAYNLDLNKNEELKKLLLDNCEYIKEKDGMNREDKLLANYGLSRESSKAEIIAKRDAILDELYRQQRRTRYIDKARRIKKRFNLVKEEFDLILDRYDNPTLSGDLSKKEVRIAKKDALFKYYKIVDELSKFAVETEKEDEIADTSKNAFNYAYEGMSDKEISEVQQDLNTHPIKYTSYGNNTHDYLEPIEYFPNTNIRKPRVRGPFETDEHYEAFLAEYYSRYDFSNPKKTTQEETERFYSDKAKYAEATIQGYFGKLRDALANLRWFYNYSLNETSNIESDIEFYTEKISKQADKADTFRKYISESKKEREVFQEFITDYEQKVDSVNTIMGTIFNEPALVGDTSLTIEISKDGDKVNAIVSPLITLVDNENRKKYANYSVDEDGKTIPFDEYEFDANNMTNSDVDIMLNDFVQQIIDQGAVDLDMETVKKANVEVVYGDKTYVMPYEDLGVNVLKMLKLGGNAYVASSSYKDDPKVVEYVNNNGIEQAQEEIEPEIELPAEVEEKVEEAPVVDEVQEETPEVQVEESAEHEVEEPVQEVQSEEVVEEQIEPEVETEEDTPVVNEEETQTEKQTSEKDIILPPPLPIGIEDKGGVNQTIENEFIDSDEEKDEYDEAEVDNSLVEEDTQEEIEETNGFDPGQDYHIENEDDEYDYDEPEDEYNQISEPTISSGLELDEAPLTQEELRSCYKVTAIRKPRNFAKTIAAGVVGGVLTAFGLASVNGLAITGGSALLTGTVIQNWKNIKRAVMKFKLKNIAKRHGVKVFFGTKGRIEMKNPDGSDLTPEQEDWIQYDIDKKINSWNDPDFVPQVTLDDLGSAFIMERDENAYYVATKKEVSDYKKMKQGETKFESVSADVDLFGEEEELEPDEELEEPENEPEEEQEEVDDRPVLYGNVDDDVQIKNEADLMHELVRLNPELAREFKQDVSGFWLEIPHPENIRLPKGFEYIDGVGITNIDNTDDEPIKIDVFKSIDFDTPIIEDSYDSYEPTEDIVDEIVEKYGVLLDGISDEDIQRISELDPNYTVKDVQAAADKYNNGRSL